SPKVKFLLQDATKPWQVDGQSQDVVYSNMVLNEIEDIDTACAEAFRVLRPGGLFAFSVVHPGWALFIYAQHQAGVEPRKIKGLGGYFRRGPSKFIMGGDEGRDDPSSEPTKERAGKFEVEHYQRPISDYVASFGQAGF